MGLKTLFITYAYPPSKYPRSVQISHLVQYLRKKIDLTVMAPSLKGNHDLSLLQFTPLDNVLYSSKSLLTQMFDKIGGYRVKKNLFLDTSYFESRDLWISSYKLLREEKYHSIVTFGQPMSVHMVGLKLKEKFPDLRWIAHFSDPWTDNPYHQYNFWVRCINQYYQSQVFKKADRLVFTSLGTIDLVMQPYNEGIRKKAVYLPHCFNENLYPSSLPARRDGIIVRYLGNFYGDRQPHCLFKALRLLKSKKKLPPLFKVELIGAEANYQEDVLREQIEDIVSIKPSIPYLESLQVMSQSDMLLVIDAPVATSPFFPSKLVDYIGANRPIFGITPQGVSKRILEELGFLTADPSRPEDIAEKLLEMVNQVQRTKGNIPSHLSNKFSIEEVGQQALRLLKQHVDSDPPAN